MSITITTDVFCDICGNWIFGVVGRTANARSARRHAKEDGWIRERRDGKLVDVCPHCKAEEVSITVSPLRKA